MTEQKLKEISKPIYYNDLLVKYSKEVSFNDIRELLSSNEEIEELTIGEINDKLLLGYLDIQKEF